MEKKQLLAIAKIILLCLMVLGNFVNITFGFIAFIAFEFLCTASFLLLLFLAWKEYKKGFSKYLAYFSFLYLAVIFLLFHLISPAFLGVQIEIFIYAILAILLINIGFRLILGRKEVEGKVLLSDNSLAVVELPFDLFAGIASGKYVVKSSRKLKKGDRVKVKLKQSFFRRKPERIA